jgi:YidC/Oxa1 family membrane protein insertase
MRPARPRSRPPARTARRLRRSQPRALTQARAAAPRPPAPAISQELAESDRIGIETPSVTGSISLQGGRIDTLLLSNYRETLDPGAPNEQLLQPLSSDSPYFVWFGWAPGGSLDFAAVPGPNTEWTLAEGDTLTPEAPVTLQWDNGSGLVFRRTIAVDDKYMFTVTQSVENTTDTAVRLAPEARVERIGEPDDLKGFFILHEGVIRQKDSERDFIKYKDLRDLGTEGDWAYGSNLADAVPVNGTGWVGFTDHYWHVGADPVLGCALPVSAAIRHRTSDTYRTITRTDTFEVAPGETAENVTRVFSPAPRNGRPSATIRTKRGSTISSTRSTGAGSSS